MHMRMAAVEQALITAVLDVDPEAGDLIVDAAADDSFNRLLARPGNVHFSASLDKVRIQFAVDGPATAQDFEGRAALRLPFPDSLQRIQRRDHYRIDIPVRSPLLCQIRIPGGRMVTLKAKDLSAGGIALFDPDSALDVTPETRLSECRLDLDDLGEAYTDLTVRRVGTETVTDARPARVIACEFANPSPIDANMIRNYLGRLERMLNARRRGFD